MIIKKKKNFTYLNILDVQFFKYSEKHESLFNHQQSMNHETLHKTLTWSKKAKYDQLQHGWSTISKFHFEHHPTRSSPVTSVTKRSSPENSETHLLSTLSWTLTWFQIKFDKSKKNQSWTVYIRSKKATEVKTNNSIHKQKRLIKNILSLVSLINQV